MIGKNLLLDEISNKTKYKNSLFMGRFEDEDLNNEYNKQTGKQLIYQQTIIGIIIIIYITYITVEESKISPSLSFRYICLSFLILNLATLLAILFNDKSGKLNCFLVHFKYISETIFFYAVLVNISIFRDDNKLYHFSVHLYFQYFILWVDALNFKYFPKLISIVTFLGFIGILLFTNFTIYGLKLENTSLGAKINLSSHCTTIRSYNSQEYSNKTNNSMFQQLFNNETESESFKRQFLLLQNVSMSEIPEDFSLTLEFESFSLKLKTSYLKALYYGDKSQIYELNSFFQNIITANNLVQNTRNFLDFEFKSDEFPNFTNCVRDIYSKANSKYMFYIFSLYNFYIMPVGSEIILIKELVFCLVMQLFFWISSIFYKDKQEIFSRITNSNHLIDYFDNLVNSMDLSMISFKVDNVLSINNSFLDKFKRYCSKMNDKIEKMKSSDLKNMAPLEYFKKEESNGKIEKNTLCQCAHNVFKKIEYSAELNQSPEVDSIFKENNTNLFSLYQGIIKNEIIINDKKKEEAEEEEQPQNLNNIHTETEAIKSTPYTNNLNKKKNKLNCFYYFGIFTYEKQRFYKVYARKFYLNNEHFILDFLIDDITEIKYAEKLNLETKIKHKIFSKIAHEFKTPLLIIKSLVSNYNSSSKIEKEQISSHILYISDYVSFLINDIIYYANDEAMKISISEVDIKEIITFCLEVAKSLLLMLPGNKKNVSATSHIEEEVFNYIIKTDQTRIKQVLLNLISNSVKFTKYGEISLNASLKSINGANCICISVKDTGSGIKEEDLVYINNQDNKKVISINTQCYNEMGTGLGLGITKSILNKLGHNLIAESTYGEGSEFKILI